jgi:hypothetical protein
VAYKFSNKTDIIKVIEKLKLIADEIYAGTGDRYKKSKFYNFVSLPFYDDIRNKDFNP